MKRNWAKLSGGCLARAVLIGGLPLLATGARAEAVPTKTFDNPDFHYSVALPLGCSLEVPAAASLLLEVDAEPVPQDASKGAADLAQHYNEASFRDELPEAVCGEADRTRVKIDNVKQVLDAARVVYTASVACPEIRFLGLGERDGMAQFLITPGWRYRLLARAPKDEFDQNRAAIDAFFASFKTAPAETRNQ